MRLQQAVKVLWGMHAKRLALTLQCHAVHDVQGSKWLPYEELVDWNDFAVVISGHQMVNGGLQHKIDALQPRVAQMKYKLARVRHMFTYNYTMHYIVESLQTRIPT